MQPKRIPEIDALRGIAMVGMILIHTSYYFLSNKIALFLWNWSQFAVPVFVFCSAYLFFQKNQNIELSGFKKYILKRLIRLLVPYYIFMIFFFTIVFFREPIKLNTSYIMQSVFTIGGIDISWLVLLFLQLTIIMPIITLFSKKK